MTAKAVREPPRPSAKAVEADAGPRQGVAAKEPPESRGTKKAAPKTARRKAAPAAKQATPAAPAAALAKTAPISQLKDTIMATAKTANTTDYTAKAQNMAADMQTRVKAAYEKGTAMTKEAAEFQKGNLEAVVESGKILASGMQDMGRSYAEEAKSAAETVQDDVKKFAAIKSPTELFQLQGEIAPPQFRRHGLDHVEEHRSHAQAGQRGVRADFEPHEPGRRKGRQGRLRPNFQLQFRRALSPLSLARRIGHRGPDGFAIRPLFFVSAAQAASVRLSGRANGTVLAARALRFRASDTIMGSAMAEIPPLTPIRAAGEDDDSREGDGQVGIATKTRAKPKKPSQYKVLLLNDDYTPMEFVVIVLKRFFKMDMEEATRVMLHVHQKGVGVCGIFPYEVAETKVNQVMDFARQNQHPLQCTLEKA